MTDTILLTFDFLSPSQNATDKWHWGKKTHFRNDVQLSIRQQLAEKNRKPWWQPHVSVRREDLFQRGKRVRLVVRRYSSSRLDHGNLVGGFKPMLDALVREGLIFDDSPEWLEDTYEQHPAPRGEGRTEVEITR